MKETPTWDELQLSLDTASQNPNEAAWQIYRYMAANVGKELTSELARTLLLFYCKLPVQRPSLLHSLMLAVSLKMAEVYPDFKFPGFLQLWNIRMLRAEDRQRQLGKDGKQYASLLERLTNAALKYRLRHPKESFDSAAQTVIDAEAARLGYGAVIPMVAVKMHEKEHEGRKLRFVKLIGPKGEEMMAEWHVFRCKLWEIEGRLWEVLPRTSGNGAPRVAEVAPSAREMTVLFPARIGFVDRYDEQHGHFHIFDNLSRHFVADKPELRPQVGDYVWFCPIIPEKDKFKTAILVRKETKITGRQLFGETEAKVEFVDKDKGYFRFASLGNEASSSDERKGFAKLALSPRPLAVGDTVRLIMYLRRGKDGEKRWHVAEIL